MPPPPPPPPPPLQRLHLAANGRPAVWHSNVAATCHLPPPPSPACPPRRLASKWFGDSLKYTRAAFSLAAKLAPCVLFIDEVDSLLGRRNSQKEHEAMR